MDNFMKNESSFCSTVRNLSSSKVYFESPNFYFHRLKKEVILAKIPDWGACGDVAFYLIFNRFIDFKKVDITVSHCKLELLQVALDYSTFEGQKNNRISEKTVETRGS